MPYVRGERRSGRISVQRVGGMNVVRNTFHYDIMAESLSQDRMAIISATNFPKVGDIDPLYGYCIGTNAEREVDQPLLWRGEAEFSTEAVEGHEAMDTNNGNTDPTTWIPIAELQYEVYEEAVRKDLTSPTKKFWRNTAGQPFADPLLISKTIICRDFFQFEPASTTIDALEDRNNKINSAIFAGRAVKTLLLQVKSAKLGYYYGTRCWLVEYRMKYRPDTWSLTIPSWGQVAVDGSGKPVTLLDKNATSIVTWPLDVNGAAKTNVTDDPYEMTFEKYEQDNFNTYLRLR